jgi:hypothetical protein
MAQARERIRDIAMALRKPKMHSLRVMDFSTIAALFAPSCRLRRVVFFSLLDSASLLVMVLMTMLAVSLEALLSAAGIMNTPFKNKEASRADYCFRV